MKKYLLVASLLFCLLSIPARASEPPVTRGQFAVLLWETQGGVPFDKTAHPFSDLPDDEQAQAVAWAWDLGLVKGVGGDRFAPGRPLTRLECAVLLRRLDDTLGRDTFLPAGAAACNDSIDTTPWAGDDLYWACVTARMDWLDGRLAPQGSVSPEEAAELLR